MSEKTTVDFDEMHRLIWELGESCKNLEATQYELQQSSRRLFASWSGASAEEYKQTYIRWDQDASGVIDFLALAKGCLEKVLECNQEAHGQVSDVWAA